METINVQAVSSVIKALNKAIDKWLRIIDLFEQVYYDYPETSITPYEALDKVTSMCGLCDEFMNYNHDNRCYACPLFERNQICCWEWLPFKIFDSLLSTQFPRESGLKESAKWSSQTIVACEVLSKYILDTLNDIKWELIKKITKGWKGSTR